MKTGESYWYQSGVVERFYNVWRAHQPGDGTYQDCRTEKEARHWIQQFWDEAEVPPAFLLELRRLMPVLFHSPPPREEPDTRPRICPDCIVRAVDDDNYGELQRGFILLKGLPVDRLCDWCGDMIPGIEEEQPEDTVEKPGL